MNTKCRRIVTLATTLCLAATLPFATGCSISGLLGPNFTLSLILPLGLGGTPGLFNTFGSTQALANFLQSIVLGGFLPTGF